MKKYNATLGFSNMVNSSLESMNSILNISEHKFISRRLANDDVKPLKINKKLIAKLGIETACIYSELLAIQIESLKSGNYELINNKPYFNLSIEHLLNNFGLSAHKQRSVLTNLQNYGLIQVYYDSNNVRMIYVEDDYQKISDLLNPPEEIYNYWQKNISIGLSNLKEYIAKNFINVQNLNIASNNDDFEEFLKSQLITTNSSFERKIFQLFIDDEVKEEFASYNKILK